MRKRILLPIIATLIFLPFIVYVLSYTRFFNDEAESLLMKIVDSQTNARLYIGKIHGSIFGSFWIDGAALTCDNNPVVLVDTIRITHLPLSMIAKAMEVLRIELVHPRFYLVRSRDGTLNVDHIGKATSSPGGKFGWFVAVKDLRIRNGEFSFYDSTGISSSRLADSAERFDPSDFDIENLDVLGSVNISDDDLTASVKQVSFDIDRIGMKVSSLKCDFFSSDVGTELSSFSLRSDLASIDGDITLTGQNMMKKIDMSHLLRKHITANLDAENIDFRELEKFISLPIDPVSKVGMNCYTSGDLDTLYVKQLSLKTDSSIVPLSATLYNVVDSSIAMKVETRGALINPAEISAMLKGVGLPDLGLLKPLLVQASADGSPSNLKLKAHVVSGETDVAGDADVHDGTYGGHLKFRNVRLGEILNSRSLNVNLTGNVDFTLRNSRTSFPEGDIVVQIDSSGVERAFIRNGSISVSSAADSLSMHLNFFTSRGNIDGTASLDIPERAYSADLAFSKIDLSSFLQAPSLNGESTGRLALSGSGFNVDSLEGSLLVVLDSSTIGPTPIAGTAIRFFANTKDERKDISVTSPFLDASVTGHFQFDKLPAQLSRLLVSLADSFSSKLTGFHRTLKSDSAGLSEFDAAVDVKVKDARFVGKLLGETELYGNPEAHLDVSSDADRISVNGSVDADSVGYSNDSLSLHGSRMNAEFNLNTSNRMTVWDSAKWSLNATFHSLDVNHTRIASKILRVNYTSPGSSGNDSISITALGQIDTLAEFYVDAAGTVRKDSIELTTNTLLGKLYRVSLTSTDPFNVTYSPQVFTFSPATFTAGLGPDSSAVSSRVSVQGQLSIEKGPDLQIKFSKVALAALQKMGRVDTNSLKLKGEVNGAATLIQSPSGLNVAISFNGKDVDYNGSMSKLLDGNVKIFGDYLDLSAELSKPSDSSSYALRVNGTIPLSDSSKKGTQLRITADSLNISFLTPFLPGIDNLEGTVSGNMIVAGRYSLPDFKGELRVHDGKIVRLAANEISYPFDGTIQGKGDMLILTPVEISNTGGQTTTSMMARGSLEIRNNTIAAFDIDLDGTLLALNSISRQANQKIYGTAIVGSGTQGLKLMGSLARPFLEGSGIIQSTTLTLMPLQSKQTSQIQDVVYRFPVDTATEKTSNNSVSTAEVGKEAPSGSFVDSLRYDLSIDTKDNVNFRMIFDPTTNEELDAVLGGKLHLSNLSGSMELIGEVNILTGSTYNFYGKQFNATGKIRFTGDPLNPVLDITGIYQGQHSDTSSTGKPQNVVVQLRITGTFNQPSVDITMNVDNVPYSNDQQTNAISFILTGQFAEELTSAQKQNVANSLWSQTGAGVLGSVGSSVLSGYLTNFLGKQFDFIQSVGLQYNSNASITDPNVQITTKLWDGTLKVQTPIVTDIASTGFSLMYPIWGSLIAEASRNVTINNRTLGQRETTDMLRLFYQISF